MFCLFCWFILYYKCLLYIHQQENRWIHRIVLWSASDNYFIMSCHVVMMRHHNKRTGRVVFIVTTYNDWSFYTASGVLVLWLHARSSLLWFEKECSKMLEPLCAQHTCEKEEVFITRCYLSIVLFARKVHFFAIVMRVRLVTILSRNLWPCIWWQCDLNAYAITYKYLWHNYDSSW